MDTRPPPCGQLKNEARRFVSDAPLPRNHQVLGDLGGFELFGGAGGDFNLTRLFFFWNCSNELDVQKTVFKFRACDIHVVGQLELALERAARDAAVQVFAVFFLCFL